MAAQPKPLYVRELNYLEGGGIYGWLTTIDHKRIAVLYGMTALVMLLFGGTEAMLVRTQLMVPDNHFLTAQKYNEFFTMHGLTSAANRRAGRRLSSAECAQLLGFSAGGDNAQSRLDLGRAAERRLVRLRQFDRALLLTRPQYRLL